MNKSVPFISLNMLCSLCSIVNNNVSSDLKVCFNFIQLSQHSRNLGCKQVITYHNIYINRSPKYIKHILELTSNIIELYKSNVTFNTNNY